MDLYEMTDQPETCRQCGRRTRQLDERVDREEGIVIQLHRCPACGYMYELEGDL